MFLVATWPVADCRFSFGSCGNLHPPVSIPKCCPKVGTRMSAVEEFCGTRPSISETQKAGTTEIKKLILRTVGRFPLHVCVRSFSTFGFTIEQICATLYFCISVEIISLVTANSHQAREQRITRTAPTFFSLLLFSTAKVSAWNINCRIFWRQRLKLQYGASTVEICGKPSFQLT